MLSGNRGDGTRAFSQTARVGFTDTISKNSFSKLKINCSPWTRPLRQTLRVWCVWRQQVLQNYDRLQQEQLNDFLRSDLLAD